MNIKLHEETMIVTHNYDNFNDLVPFFLRSCVMKSSRPLFVFLFILLLCNLIMTINSESNKPFRFHSRRWILRRNKQKKPDTKSNGKRYVGSLSEDTRMETTTRDSPNVSELTDAVFI